MIAQPSQAKLVKLFEVQRELLEKLVSVQEEIDTEMAGKPGIAARIRTFESNFQGLWEIRYKTRYVFTPTQDKPMIKRLLKLFTDEQLDSLIASYIRSGDEFLVKNRHPLTLFQRSINGLAPSRAAPDEADADAPADCKHKPRCKSDQEHTKRKMAEMHGLAF